MYSKIQTALFALAQTEEEISQCARGPDAEGYGVPNMIGED